MILDSVAYICWFCGGDCGRRVGALTRKMRLPGDGDGAQTNYALGNVTDQGRITR